MLTLRVEMGPLEEATPPSFRLEPPCSTPPPLSFPFPLLPDAAPVAAESLSAPLQFSNKSTTHHPPAFFPTTVPRRPVSRRRTRIPVAISAPFVVGASVRAAISGVVVELSLLLDFIAVARPRRRIRVCGAAVLAFEPRPVAVDNNSNGGRSCCCHKVLRRVLSGAAR